MDLLLFHKIVHHNICIKFPNYIRLVTPCSMPNPLRRLRPRQIFDIQNDHPIFQCSLKHIPQCQEDPLLFTCIFKPRTVVNETTYFIRSYREWNKLPLCIRNEDNYEIYQTKLTEYIWETLKEKSGWDVWPDWS